MASGGKVEKRVAYLRLGTKEDVPTIKLLVDGLAEAEKQTDNCFVTEAALESSLFGYEPFLGPTVILLELGPPSSSLPPIAESKEIEAGDLTFHEKSSEVSIDADIEDPSESTFRSRKDETRTVVGFTISSLTYSTYLSKRCLYLGDMFVRGCYRRQGFGKLLLSEVARQAANRGYGRVEWTVLDWNVNAIKFYESMGTDVDPDWRSCRLTGAALEAYRDKSCDK